MPGLHASTIRWLEALTGVSEGVALISSLPWIEAAYRGEVILCPIMAKKVLEHFGRSSRVRTPGLPYEELTQRELQVLQLAADGMSNKEIAAELFITEKTAKNHIANIFSRLQVNDRTQAILYALRKGLVSLSPGDPT